MLFKNRKSPASAGAPAWMTTFADLMTLLMSFFVLMLSLAEIDALKYRAVAGEMKKALGVKVDSIVDTLPDGSEAELKSPPEDEERPAEADKKCAILACELERIAQGEVTDSQYDLVKRELAQFAAEQNIIIAREEHKVLIRIQEQGVFPSGSDRISPIFLPVIAKVRDAIAELPGGIRVSGHTDDVPISNGRFRSNWELSSARAVSVLHELLKDGAVAPERASAMGFADSRPIVPNTSNANRAVNRRVDIILVPRPD